MPPASPARPTNASSGSRPTGNRASTCQSSARSPAARDKKGNRRAGGAQRNPPFSTAAPSGGLRFAPPALRGRDPVLLRDEAAVDDQFGAGDERGFVGGEEQHAIGHLNRLAEAAQRGQRDLVVALAGIGRVQHRRQ